MTLIRLKTATLLAGLAGAIALPGVAQAQFYFDSWGGRFDVPLPRDDGRDYDAPYRRDDRPYREAAQISRSEIAAMLSRRGYRVSPSIARNDDVYLVTAIDPSGRQVRLVVDAFDGSVLQRIAVGRDRDAPPRGLARREDPDAYDDDDFGAPPRSAEPRVIPGVGPAQRKPAPKKDKPATARVEPRAPAPKPAATPEPAPSVQAAPATPPAPVAATRTTAPQARAEAPAKPAATTEPSPTTAPRVIPLYKTPSEGDGGKPADGAP